MTRLSALVLSVLIAAAPLSAAHAQDRGQRGDRSPPDAQREVRVMSASQAFAIAQSRAQGAEFKNRVREQGGIYTFTFERDGRVFEVVVDGRL